MTSLFSQGNESLNKTGSIITFSDTSLNLVNIPLYSSIGNNWAETSNHSIYNVSYVENREGHGLNFGPKNPLILVIEKASDSSNNLLRIWEFELSFDRTSAFQNGSVLSTTPVGLAAVEQYYGVDLNKNTITSNYGLAPKTFQLEELSSGFVFDFSYLEGVSQTGLTYLLTPLKVSVGTSWSVNSATESVHFAIAYTLSGSSAAASTFELKVLTDLPSAAVTGSFSAYDGFSINSFTLDSAGSQFTLYASASATPTDFAIFEYNVGQDLNSDGYIGNHAPAATSPTSIYNPSYNINNKSAGSSFLFGSAYSSNHTIFQTSGEIVSFNGNFYQYDFNVLGNDGAGVFGYSHFSTEDQKAGSSIITPDVLLLDGTSPWQPASYVSPNLSSQLGTFPTAHGVLAISAAAGAGGITFVTDFHDDVYVFQATTATNVSTTLSVFENSYYFEFDPSAASTQQIGTAAPTFQLTQSLQISGDILSVIEKNIGHDVNNDSVNGVMSATQVLSASAHTKTIVTHSGETSITVNSPKIFSGQGGFLIWNQSAGYTSSVKDSASDNEFFILADASLGTWSASGSLSLTGAYRSEINIGSSTQVAIGPNDLTRNTEEQLSFSLVFDTQTSNTFGSVYSVYSFSLHSAIDSIAIADSSVKSFAVRDLQSYENTLGYDITGDGVVGNSGLNVQTVIAIKTSSALETSAQSASLVKLDSGDYAISQSIPTVSQPTDGKLLINSSSTQWVPSTGSSAVGIYGNVIDSASATQSYVVVQKQDSSTGSAFSTWTFSSDTSLLTLQTNQSTASDISLIDLLNKEMSLGFDVTGDFNVGDSITKIVLNSTTVPQDTNNDGINDSTKIIPAVINTSFGLYGIDYDISNIAVGNSHPFTILKNSTGNSWQPTTNYKISGVYETESVNNQSVIGLIERGGSDTNPFYQKWSFVHGSASNTAQVSAASATRLSISEIVAEEQRHGVDLDGNGKIGDDVERYIFLAPNHPALVETQIGNYALSFQEVLGVNSIGLPILTTTSGKSWLPTRGNTTTGVFSERTGSAQSVSIIESSGSTFSPSYKQWLFNLTDGAFFATASTAISVDISSAKLAALETRKNIDLLGDGVIGDPIKSVIVAGGNTPIDSDNDGFNDGNVTAPSITINRSNSYALDLTGTGQISGTPSSLFLESFDQKNWQPTSSYDVIGGYVQYGINSSSLQTTSAFIFEQSGSGSTAIYKSWHFLQGSASGVATATSSIAQTISLTDILSKELELGFDLNNDDVVGDRVIEVTSQLQNPQTGAPSVVKLASGSYAVDFEGNSSVGQLKPVVNLKTSNGQEWAPSQNAEIIGVYNIEELESSGQIKYYSVIFEKVGSGSSVTYNKWIFSKPSSQTFLQASASTSSTVSLTDILSKEGFEGFDLNSDGVVGDKVVDITWQVLTNSANSAPSNSRLLELTSGAYGIDFENKVTTGSTTPLVVLQTSTGSSWNPTSGAIVTGVYSTLGGTTANPTNQSILIEKTGNQNFPVFKTWTFTDDASKSSAKANSANSQPITESALLQKELDVGFDLNGDQIVGNGIFSVILPTTQFTNSTGQIENSPAVVRLSSGDFGLVLGSNNYVEGSSNSFLLKEIQSNGNPWRPFTSPTSDGSDYYVSGAELTDDNLFKIYEVIKSDKNDPTVKLTTFIQPDLNINTYFIKDSLSDTAALTDSDFFQRELEVGYNLDKNNVLGPGALQIPIESSDFIDQYNVAQKSPIIAKLADGSIGVDFKGVANIGETPELILYDGNQLYRYDNSESLLGTFTSSELNETTQRVSFNVNIVHQGSITETESYFLRSFKVADDTSATFDTAKASQKLNLTEVLSKEEVLRYDLDNSGQVGFQNRELLMPAFMMSPGPDDFRLVKTETSAIGLDTAFSLTTDTNQKFYSVYDVNGANWGTNDEFITGLFVESRVNDSGEETKVQLRTDENADKVLGIVTTSSSNIVSTSTSFNLYEFVISGDASANVLGLYEFHMISANVVNYSLDELSIIESDKGFDLTGDRQILGNTAVESFRQKMLDTENARNIVSGELTNLPRLPSVSETVSELLMPGVSLEKQTITYGNLNEGLKKGTVNSFLSNGNISLDFDTDSENSSGSIEGTALTINTQVELDYYTLDEPISESGDLIQFVGVGSKDRALNSFEAITQFTDVLDKQNSENATGDPVLIEKLKLFDFSKNDPAEVDSDEIIMQLSEGEGVVLIGPNNSSGTGTFINLKNNADVSSSEILLIGDFVTRGGEGNQTVVGDEGVQDISLGMGDDIIYAGGGDDIVRTTGGDNYFDGGSGNDEIFSGNGRDTFVGGSGDDKFDGGDGFDKAQYVGSFYDFDIQKQLDTFSVKDKLSLEGTDTLTNIERLEFSDGTLAFDTDGNAGQAYRLYQAAFERTPDPIGVGYHVNDIESNGLILYQVASNFLASPEFEMTYGKNLSDTDFVNALYDNVLGRSAEEFEKNYYLDRFSRAESDPLWMDRSGSLIGFSESPENMNIVNADILNGIWMTNDYI